MIYKIIWSASFFDELSAIYQYISFQLHEPLVAKNLFELITSKINSLSYFPERNPILFKNNGIVLRKLRVKNYLIVYQVNHFSKQVIILHIFHR